MEKINMNLTQKIDYKIYWQVLKNHEIHSILEMVQNVIRDILPLHQRRLARDLSGDLVVRQTSRGEKRELLA